MISAEVKFDLVTTNYVQVSSLMLLVYDHLLTFRQEVDFVWRGVHTRSWPRLLFLAGRYAPLVVSIANAITLLHPRLDASGCRQWLLFEGWVGFAFFAAVQVISQLRLWAVYRRLDVVIAMGVVMIVGLIAMGLVEGLGYSHVHTSSVTTLAANMTIPTCGPGKALPRYVAFFWIPPIIIETLSVTLVVSKALQHYRNGMPKHWAASRFMYSIARYSVVYFVAVLFVYVANFIIWFQFQIPRLELLIPLSFSLPCVMGNRMLLGLRAVFYVDHGLLPGKDDINMMQIVERQDAEVTIQAQNCLSEFDSFFGENSSAKNQPIMSSIPITIETVVAEDLSETDKTPSETIKGKLSSEL